MGRGIVKEENKKVRKVFIEDLPRKDNRINWKKSIGLMVKGIYEGTEFEIEIVDYKEGYLYIKYLDEEPLKIWTTSFRNCSLGSLLRKRTGEFKIEIGTIFKDEHRDIIIIDRKKQNGDKYYKYKCNKCGFKCGEHYKNQEHIEESWVLECSLSKQKSGCSCCANQIVVEGINDIPSVAPFMIKFFPSGYEQAKKYNCHSGKKIIPICPECGRIKEKGIVIFNIFNSHSVNCTCSDKISYPNKFAYSLLDQLNGIYGFDYLEHEYSPDWIGRKSYDNYFIHKGKEYILEMDGGWHKIDNRMSGQTTEQSLIIDDYKDKMAKKHDIEVIRINCEKSELEFIKQNIVCSQLNELFDLSKINWLKAEEFALSNFVRQACEYKKNNVNMTTTQIGKIMRLDRHTILSYLKRGTKLGWCDYNVENEMVLVKENRINNCKKSLSKPISMFKDGIWLRDFESITECSKRSEELFGVKLYDGNIHKVLKGKRSHHGGFTFQYQ